jgi:probable phosphoglycerate mutase
MNKTWPEWITLVRHGQSAGNVALESALENGLSLIDIEYRDVDVPLSKLGEDQARALGDWYKKLPEGERPTLILTSPYVRAEETAHLIREAMGSEGSQIKITADERLREREFGIVDRLTKKGIIEKYPEQAELRSRIKKFYYRAPGGESWCDVILRLRSVLDSLARDYTGERVMVVCHTVVIFCFRYLFEKLSEKEILAIDAETRMANCSVTQYFFDHDDFEPRLEKFNFVAPLTTAGEKVTRKPDADTVPR